ncbi:MAG: hypothetical protein J6S14_15900 [Clostridia bacterium]|nr:hypothetical protein [Clostridia bacterium]
MENRNCKKCIWLDSCLSDKEKLEVCDDYFYDEEEALLRHLSKERIQYQKEWNTYTDDAD